MTSKTRNRFSPEVRERAVRMVLEHAAEYPSRWQTIVSIAAKIGCTGQTLNEEAVVAFRAALEEMIRVRVPLDWATTQSNLGAALAGLGERESGTAPTGSCGRMERMPDSARVATSVG